MVLAALAGVLAIAGAFLLVSYLGNSGDEAAAGSAGAVAAAAADARQVLIVTQTIPRGSSASWISENAAAYLTARAVPADYIAATAITAVQELDQMAALTLNADALPGEQLLKGRFVDLGDFESGESFFDTVATVEPPDGHQTVVLNLSANDALGGNIRAGDVVSLVGHFRVTPADGDAIELSVVVFNAIEVVNVQGSIDVAGQTTTEATEIGVATRGSLAITVAVEPDELTDLGYTMKFAQAMTLAISLPGANNDDYPRAFTSIAQIVGDDGVWLAEAENGNLVDLFGMLAIAAGAGESIDVDFPTEEEEAEAEEDPADDSQAELVEDEAAAADDEPGDS